MRAPLVALTAVALAVGLQGADAAPAPASTGTAATRALLARQRLVDRRGRTLDGSGVSIAVIDSGVEPTHPGLVTPGGASKVVANLSALACGAYGEESPYTHEISDDPSCVVPVPASSNTDAPHGGHGTFVAGVAVGNPFTLADGTAVGGVAPGARLVMISTTAALVGIDNAFAWIVKHHAAPCGPGVPSDVCPPIRVVSCSWGATTPTLVRLQDELANAGVLTVWANGNTGGDGSANHSNPDATDDPTPGVLAIAGYDDAATGTRDGQVAATSSRGRADAPQTWPDISAPGVNIISTCRPYLAICPAIETQSPRDGPGPADVATYFIGSGTSFAAPEVAGVIALLLQVAPGSSAAQIDDVLKATAYKFTSGAPYRAIGAYSSSFDKGVGLVDAYNAARRLGARRRSAR